MSYRERCGLLAYSPLGFGTLSGKYIGGQLPERSRLTLFEGRYSRYSKPEGIAATEKYVMLARNHGVSPAQMALAFVGSRPFTTSTIIGATSMEQLKENIASIDLSLDEELLDVIETIHISQPNPCP